MVQLQNNHNDRARPYHPHWFHVLRGESRIVTFHSSPVPEEQDGHRSWSYRLLRLHLVLHAVHVSICLHL